MMKLPRMFRKKNSKPPKATPAEVLEQLEKVGKRASDELTTQVEKLKQIRIRKGKVAG